MSARARAGEGGVVEQAVQDGDAIAEIGLEQRHERPPVSPPAPPATVQPAAAIPQDARPSSLARSQSFTSRYEQEIAHSTIVNWPQDET